MWPFDLLRRLLRKPETSDTGLFDDRLAGFVQSEQEGRPDGDSAPAKPSSREKIAAARQVVELIATELARYVQQRILRRYGKDFRFEQLEPGHTREAEKLFSTTRTGNETRYARLDFRDSCQIFFKAEAVILSSAVGVRVLFRDLKGGTPTLEMDVDFTRWGDISKADWEQVFERVFLDFFDWREGKLRATDQE